MSDTPKWHGWATPEQVRQMVFEMIDYLENNGYEIGFSEMTWEVQIDKKVD
jgi:hypothetical protein